MTSSLSFDIAFRYVTLIFNQARCQQIFCVSTLASSPLFCSVQQHFLFYSQNNEVPPQKNSFDSSATLHVALSPHCGPALSHIHVWYSLQGVTQATPASWHTSSHNCALHLNARIFDPSTCLFISSQQTLQRGLVSASANLKLRGGFMAMAFVGSHVYYGFDEFSNPFSGTKKRLFKKDVMFWHL